MSRYRSNDNWSGCIIVVVMWLGVLLSALIFWGFVIWAVVQGLRSLGVQF